jgi:hypothetical protein
MCAHVGEPQLPGRNGERGVDTTERQTLAIERRVDRRLEFVRINRVALIRSLADDVEGLRIKARGRSAVDLQRSRARQRSGERPTPFTSN